LFLLVFVLVLLLVFVLVLVLGLCLWNFLELWAGVRLGRFYFP